ncbi:MAG: glycosyltransferase [bacterium]
MCFRCSTAIVAISQANVKFIQKFVSSKKVTVIYNGMELSSTHTITKHDNGIIKMAYAGRLSTLKAVDILLHACAILVAEGHTHFTLDIIGEGEERTLLETYVREHTLSKLVHFL